jgi:hypothetical protein
MVGPLASYVTCGEWISSDNSGYLMVEASRSRRFLWKVTVILVSWDRGRMRQVY